MEVPILGTNYHGVPAGVLIALTLLASAVWPVEPVFAETPKRVARVSTTKGVRVKTISDDSGQTSAAARSQPRPASEGLAVANETNDGDRESVVERARGVVGARYRFGGKSPKTGFDCSGLILYAFGDKAGNLPRSSLAMYRSVAKIDDLRPGDLVFFGRGRVGHVALYVGAGQVVHASTPQRGVRTDDVSTLSRYLGYAGAGRII